MNSDFNQGYVVGVDAGGTRTRAVLADARDGRPRTEGAAGPGNALTVPVPELTDHLAEAIGHAVPEPLRGRVVAVAGGFAGASRTAADEPGRLRAHSALSAALQRLGIAAGAVEICSDIEAAFASAPGHPADGLALVAGTGAVAARITGRVCTATAGGDGWLLGDDGSGFWIGRDAVRAALRSADGRGGPTALAASVGRALGLPGDVLPYDDAAWTRAQREAYRMHLLPAVMAQQPIRLARLAPLAADAARNKDPVAEAILAEATGHLVDTVRALDPRAGERIVATGGLLGPDGPLTPLLTDRLRPLGLDLDWVADGSRGAVALARLAL
ncbi:N-acetylglucosamine kinase [Streptomyces jeddahensis]|uniref:BadF/BadG/BcrA/BcrD ATPase family protein n=1 Tax=Streptomyces jeddahensis TaxID=1716141 RepID=A0A177HVG0_9ACTN|nr:BadF/BadG/BcrA/BcrD ATPase family protein [Streptomyces jeddahensis]OAH14567.1 BadF/BadG/BcrA/BcrD ATPase family protein [Streptomyces jeddahensis]